MSRDALNRATVKVKAPGQSAEDLPSRCFSLSVSFHWKRSLNWEKRPPVRRTVGPTTGPHPPPPNLEPWTITLYPENSYLLSVARCRHTVNKWSFYTFSRSINSASLYPLFTLSYCLLRLGIVLFLILKQHGDQVWVVIGIFLQCPSASHCCCSSYLPTTGRPAPPLPHFFHFLSFTTTVSSSKWTPTQSDRDTRCRAGSGFEKDFRRCRRRR